MTTSAAEAIVHKDKGNKHLLAHELDQAVLEYTLAIELDGNNAIFYSNRAQAHIKLENYGLAISDCDEALKIDPGLLKAYYRKGVAEMAILKHKEALANFKIILTKLPNDRLTLENYKQCSGYLKRQAFERAIAGADHISIIDSINYDAIQIEKSWQGPAVDIVKKKTGGVEIRGVDLNYLRYIIELFKTGGVLPKRHVFGIVAKCHELFKNEQTMVELMLPHEKLNVVGDNSDEIVLENGKKLTIVGDTHGQFYDVLNLFKKFGHVTQDHIYLFNGDFVDRGSWSCEVALYLYVLKIIFPKQVFINRGNHETSDMNKTYGFADECEFKYSKKIFEAFTESFGALPLACLINRSYLCMHGGLFSNDKVLLSDIKAINRFPKSGSTQPPREGLAMELLWTDPQSINGRSPSKRGIGMQFGPDITERFCLNNKLRKIIRSHEVRMDGVEAEHNGRLITVFSAPNYCDATGNLGAVIHITSNSKYDANKHDEEGYRNVDDENCPWTLITETFEAVEHPDMKPMAYSKGGFGF
ncbi:Serine/threonine-protein phosphatase T [Spathaspora sp. JA1]|nr:Serine/threonine-protein phosphatase T [Spathaspora sp. JA1]